jgi:3-hydroxybutyryl-CoA dehydrogenase
MQQDLMRFCVANHELSSGPVLHGLKLSVNRRADAFSASMQKTTMAFDPSSQSFTLGVIGSGAMGSGIAQLAAQGGLNVRLFDSNQAALNKAMASLRATFDKLIERGKIDAQKAKDTLARIVTVNSLAALTMGADLIVEAIVENLDAKRALFAEIEALVGDDVVLATNTSSLSVTAIAAQLKHPGRFAGWHFFNPVPLMRVVEIVDGQRTQDAVAKALMALTERLGHTAVRAKDTPGFIVNHAGRGYGTEALRIVGEGICAFADVDRVMREACDFRLGPFELMDLTGLDVSHPVMESIYRQYYDEPRFRPSVIASQRYAAGLFGRKSGEGFYDYRAGAPILQEAPQGGTLPQSVWISQREPSAFAAVRDAIGSKCALLAEPGNADLCIVTPLGSDTTDAVVRENLDAHRTIAIDTLMPLARRRTIMTNPATTKDTRLSALALFSADGVAVTAIHDSLGFISQRILAMIVNIAADIAQQRIASPRDIDRAVQLGLNYPHGPLAFGDLLGAKRIHAILAAIHEASGDPRYRPSLWLARRARLGLSLLSEEG